MGVAPKWVKSKKRRKKREKEREKERLNDGDNNGQATHCNATSCGSRKAAWANLSVISICTVTVRVKIFQKGILI